MRSGERNRILLRGPQLLWSLLGRGRYDFSYDRIPFSTGDGMPWRKRLNLLASGANLLGRWAHPWSLPLHMQFELASACDLRCPVCPTGRRELSRRAPFLDPSLFSRVLTDVGSSLLTATLWGWGEPLLHPRLGDILQIAASYPIRTLLSTNGQRLADDGVQAALRAHPPSILIVAIDGLCDESNRRFRVGAQLAPALDGVARLAAWKKETRSALPELHLRMIVMQHNEHEVPGVEQFARDKGFDSVSLRALAIIDTAEARRVVQPFMPGNVDASFRTAATSAARGTFVCQKPFYFPTLLSDGTLVACEQDFNASHPMGVVGRDGSFRQIWHNRASRELRRKIRTMDASVSYCRNCPFVNRPDSDCSVSYSRLGAA